MRIITACTNTEVLFDSYNTEGVDTEELLDVYWSAMEAVLLASSRKYKLLANNRFRDYRGGRFREQARLYGNTATVVSCRLIESQAVKDMCEQAETAGYDAVEKRLAE